MDRPAFTIGIEEEYLVVDRETRDLIKRPPDAMWKALENVLGSQVSPEFLKAQIEVGTQVSSTVADAREDLARMRRGLSGVVNEYGAAIIASSTHPFANWSEQETTEDPRYMRLASDYQQVARQLVICGMHVHVGIEDPHLRIDLMNQVKYFLPHILALSTSSPFWAGQPTGLLAYRLVIFQNLPRTGVPEEFESWGEYERTVEILVNAGLIEDATKLWWDIRPSFRYPTLEMRVSDICTRLDDSMTVAALYLCLLGFLYRLRRENQRWRTYSPMMIEENLWRAQRYGVDGSMVDFGRGELVSYADLIEELIELLAQDATEFGVREELRHARTIVNDGTSAHRQLATYKSAVADGADEREALNQVVDELIEDTMYGL
ncbi:MAG: carboxylate-amine ligase [Actinobacteria bacterium]|nr:MAG: carboxylate-amine ligase [Actinomycetota bacterium]REK37063.1 MAG: carboxylate-amine ligase [Actinomycetota bacterium]